jgi:hypothetical protein
MATGRTIGDVAAHGALLQASCRACGHMAVIDPRSLPARYRAMALEAVAFRCTRCGARGAVGVRQPRSKASLANPQRVANLYAHGAHLGALCNTCQPVRLVYFTLAEIADQLGEPDPLVREAGRRLVCPHCRAPVLPTVSSASADRIGVDRKKG